MADDTAARNRIKTADNVFDIVEQVATAEGATLTELADCLGMAKSTVHGYLVSLTEAGYLVEADGEYHLSLTFLEHGIGRRQQYVPAQIVRQPLRRLADSTGEIAWYAVEEHGRAINIYNQEGERAISVEQWLGQPRPMHALAAGKVLLAHMPDERVDEILDRHRLVAKTANTITSRETLEAELGQIREDGVAYNDGEYNARIRSIAAPVVYDGTAIGSLGVSGPANRLRGERYTDEIPDRILATANEIELRLQQLR